MVREREGREAADEWFSFSYSFLVGCVCVEVRTVMKKTETWNDKAFARGAAAGHVQYVHFVTLSARGGETAGLNCVRRKAADTLVLLLKTEHCVTTDRDTRYLHFTPLCRSFRTWVPTRTVCGLNPNSGYLQLVQT